MGTGRAWHWGLAAVVTLVIVGGAALVSTTTALVVGGGIAAARLLSWRLSKMGGGLHPLAHVVLFPAVALVQGPDWERVTLYALAGGCAALWDYAARASRPA